LGIDISVETVVELLSRLGFELVESGEFLKDPLKKSTSSIFQPGAKNEFGSRSGSLSLSTDAFTENWMIYSNFQGVLKFSVPSFRQMDIKREIDLIEEIGRLYGYDKIPVQTPSLFINSVNQEIANLKKSKEKIRQTLVSAGFYEAQLSSLIGDSLVELDQKALSLTPFSVPDKTKNYDDLKIEMDNPLSREHRILRQSLMPGLIQAASRNYAYDKTSDIKLFEIGKVYNFLSLGPDLNSFKETLGFCAILVKSQSDWAQSKPKTLAEDFFVMKSILENLFSKMKFVNIEESAKSSSFLHPGISAKLMQGKKQIAIIGKLHPSICKEWDLPLESFVIESVLPNLSEPKFKSVANTPIIQRDITVDSSDSVNASDIQAVIEKFKSQNLKRISLVGYYRREVSVDSGSQKSTTFRLKWQSDTETLSGELIDADVVSIKALLEKELKVTFRA
jgi:phenylalanyl-tRNA synthetase beta chain